VSSEPDPADLVFRSRALAQAHPLSRLATRYVKRVVAQEGDSQPLPEIGIWAGGALLDGYCLRRVEEDLTTVASVGLDGGAGSGAGSDAEREAELDRLDEAATAIAAELRSGTSGWRSPGTGAWTIAALDQLIGKGVERRLDHWRDAVDDAAWAELETYLTWWVVKGYALRVAEQQVGPPPAGAGADAGKRSAR